MKVTVVGAGPSGLMAAEVLAAAGASVRIIDHKQAPARKFLLAGRGGLNLTHSEPLDILLDRYGEARAFLEPAIRAFPPAAVIAWCTGLGIKTFVGSSGRVFPASMKASPVLRAWLRRLGGIGVTFHPREAWAGFDGRPTILALGGASWPELGSDGAWLPIFERAGIAVQSFAPSNGRQLVQWSEHFASRFAGTPIKNVNLSVEGNRARGEVMLSRDGIEGGAIYALSRHLRQMPSARLVIDLKPDLTADEVQRRLERPRGKSSRSNHLRKTLGLQPAAIALMREAASDDPKHVVIATTGPAPIRRAISSAGGVARDEVDAFFRLKKKPECFVIGEMLDWDAPTGGYLLQACFSTARWAATECLRALR